MVGILRYSLVWFLCRFAIAWLMYDPGGNVGRLPQMLATAVLFIFAATALGIRAK